MLLSSNVLGKHFKAEQLLDNVDATSIEANPTLKPDANATSIFRNKRDVCDDSNMNCLRHYCQEPRRLKRQQSGSRDSCTAGYYTCLGFVEIVCRDYSFACLQSIQKYNFSKCAPRYELLNITLVAKGTREVRRTKSCNCA